MLLASRLSTKNLPFPQIRSKFMSKLIKKNLIIIRRKQDSAFSDYLTPKNQVIFASSSLFSFPGPVGQGGKEPGEKMWRSRNVRPRMTGPAASSRRALIPAMVFQVAARRLRWPVTFSPGQIGGTTFGLIAALEGFGQ
jgi:hypothetical protein